nr:hypothetical protein [Tanacetum cinerariifolium]
MYYPRFIKVIIHFFFTKDPSIPRRNKVNWHYVRDDQMFTMIKLVSRHQNTQQFGVMLPIKLTNEDIRDSEAYKEYYAITSGAAPPKTKASIRKTKSSSNTTITPPTAIGTRLLTSAKRKQPTKSSKGKGLTVLSKVAMTVAEQIKLAIKCSLQQIHISQASGSVIDEGTNTDNDGDDFVHPKFSIHKEEAKDEESFDPIVQTPKNSNDEGNDDASLGLNIGSEEGQDAKDDDEELYRDVNINLEGIDSLFESTPRVDVQASTTVALTAPTLPPPTIPTISQVPQAPTHPTTAPSTFLRDLLNFGSFFRFDHRLKTLESNFSKFMQTNQFAGAVSSILEIVERYMDQRMKNHLLDQTGRPRDEEKEKSQSQQVLQRNRLPRPLASLLKGPNLIKRLQPSTHQQRSQCKQIMQQKKPLTPDRAWNKTLPATHRSIQPWISALAKQADSRSSFNELMDTPVDLSVFLMNQLKVDTLTHEFLAGPTYELMKGSCKSLVELEFFLEKVYKIMGTSSGLKTWYVVQCGVKNRLAMTNMLSGESLIGGANINNSTDLQSAGSLLEIDNDKLYKFKEGNFKRLYIQDIKDMLLLLVQGKLTNLKVEERFAFNVSLRMFTRSIVIQRHVEDLQLGVECYQNKFNLTKPDTYHSDLKRKEAYTAYSNPRGFIYQNKHKQNRLMRIDELHKFSDRTLNDVQTALNDRLKVFLMNQLKVDTLTHEFLAGPTYELMKGSCKSLVELEFFLEKVYKIMGTSSGLKTWYVVQCGVKNRLAMTNMLSGESLIGGANINNSMDLQSAGSLLEMSTQNRKSDKERAVAMIQAIDKQLKTRRIMRSLEKFVGGRLYEGDFRMLQ